MRLKFLWIGKTKDPLFLGIEEKYLHRVGWFFPTERVTVPDLKKSDPHQQSTQMEREAQSILKKLSAETYVVILDQVGERFTSQELALFMIELQNRATKELAFVVGGHLGIPEKIKGLADRRLALTSLTLPHEMARIILLEQVYRAVSINKGSPYHK